MNTQKSVYNRLFSKEEKTELETHKVELGLIQDIEKIYKESQKLSQEAEGKGLGELRKVTLKVESDFLKLLRTSSEGIELIEKLKKSAKDLGIDLPKDVQGYENVLKAYEANAEDWIKMLDTKGYR